MLNLKQFMSLDDLTILLGSEYSMSFEQFKVTLAVELVEKRKIGFKALMN